MRPLLTALLIVLSCHAAGAAGNDKDWAFGTAAEIRKALYDIHRADAAAETGAGKR